MFGLLAESSWSPDPCPACGQQIRAGDVPEGYAEPHCQRCVHEIEERRAYRRGQTDTIRWF